MSSRNRSSKGIPVPSALGFRRLKHPGIEPKSLGRQGMGAMWFADVILDLPWFVASRGKIGEPRAGALQNVYDPDLETEILLYGDDEAIRHLRVMMHTDDDSTANACVDRNIQQWVTALEISSALATPAFTTAAKLKKTQQLSWFSSARETNKRKPSS